MLKTPTLTERRRDPLLGMIASLGNNNPNTEIICEGVLKIGHFGGDLLLFGKNDFDRSYPDIEGLPECCGVCDTPEQFLEDFKQVLEDSDKVLAVTMTQVHKDPDNRGKGGGWRWHKWGPYVGKGEPTQEYLDDEDEFDAGVWIYHVYDMTGLEAVA